MQSKNYILIPLSVLVLFFIYSCDNPTSAVDKDGPGGFKIINTYPHNPESFTQGLIYHDGSIYESTGRYGKSSLLKVEIKTGEAEKVHKLSDHLFGEGITLLNGKIYQLTWRAKKGIIYNAESFNVEGFFNYPFEGWGITNDGENLIISNGTQYIYFYNPDKFEQVRKIRVKDKGEQVSLVNELEFIEGKIYANIWRSDKIISIDPGTGKVLRWYDLSGLRNHLNGAGRLDVLNGIAYDSMSGNIFVTGKLWPKLFEINLD